MLQKLTYPEMFSYDSSEYDLLFSLLRQLVFALTFWLSHFQGYGVNPFIALKQLKYWMCSRGFIFLAVGYLWFYLRLHLSSDEVFYFTFSLGGAFVAASLEVLLLVVEGVGFWLAKNDLDDPAPDDWLDATAFVVVVAVVWSVENAFSTPPAACWLSVEALVTEVCFDDEDELWRRRFGSSPAEDEYSFLLAPSSPIGG